MRKILICHQHVDGFEKYICTCISVKYQVIFISQKWNETNTVFPRL